MYNKVFIEGNLTRDIELKNTSSGLTVANGAIATTRKFKSKTGESKEEVLFVDLTFFGRTAEIANQYLRKGSNILIDGRLQLDQWTDQSGQKRSKHSVVVENLQMINSAPPSMQSQKSTDTTISYEPAKQQSEPEAKEVFDEEPPF